MRGDLNDDWEQGLASDLLNSFIFHLHLSLWVNNPNIPVNCERGFQKGSVNVTSPSLFRTDHNFYGFQQMSWFLELSFHVTELLRHLLPKSRKVCLFFHFPGSRAYFAFISCQSFCFSFFMYLFCPLSFVHLAL